MKRKNTIWSLVLALVMVLGVIAPLGALAAEPTVTSTVTLHKMLMTKDAISAKKVTVKNGETSETKTIVKKVETKQDAKTKKLVTTTTYYAYPDMTNALPEDNDYVKGYATGEAVFPGKIGLNDTKYIGEAIGSTELEGYFGSGAKQMPGVFFAWQVAGKEKDASGNAQYIKATNSGKTDMAPVVTNGAVEFTSNLDEAFGAKTNNDGSFEFKTATLPKGSYKIVEIKEKSDYKAADNKGDRLGRQVAVPVEITLPLVNEKGVVPNAHVYPKNVEEKPKIDKNFAKKHGLTKIEDKGSNIDAGADYANYLADKAKAQAKIGKDIPYDVKTRIDAGTSYERLIWNDTMTNGLTFNKNLEIVAKAVAPGSEAGAEGDVIQLTKDEGPNKPGDYKLIQDNNGFRLQMTDAGLKKIKAVTVPEDKNVAQKDVEITLTYSAKINTTAVSDHPEKNNVTLEYGHKKGKDLEKKPVTPKDGKLNVTKNFEDGANTEGLKLVYTLEKDGVAKASVALDNKTVNKTIDLGNGIKFVVGAKAFNGEFSGLKGTGWTISERVAGYNPEYATNNADGTVTINNKKDNDNPPPLEPTTPEVYVGGKKFVKVKEGTEERLAGAKFVVKNDAGKYLIAKSIETVETEEKDLTKAKKDLDDAVAAYNKNTDDTKKAALEKAVKEKQDAYNAAFKTAGTRYEWADAKTGNNVITLTSNAKGQFEIDGLEYGTYYLEEIEAPVVGDVKYAKINDPIKFIVDKDSYKTEANGIDYKLLDAEGKVITEGNKEKTDGQGKRIDNRTVTIPETGGMGTVLFMVVGVALMGGAFIAMRKRSAEQA